MARGPAREDYRSADTRTTGLQVRRRLQKEPNTGIALAPGIASPSERSPLLIKYGRTATRPYNIRCLERKPTLLFVAVRCYCLLTGADLDDLVIFVALSDTHNEIVKLPVLAACFTHDEAFRTLLDHVELKPFA